MGKRAAPSQAPLKALGVASEMFPLLKTGGLADVVGALPAALAPLGIEMRTLLPGHPAVTAALQETRELCLWPAWFGGPARLLAGRHGALQLVVLDAPHLYARHGNPYLDATGRDWADNPVRYAALAHAAARIGWGEVPDFVPAVLHAHDWQAALVPAYLHYLGHGRRRPATVLTLHNLAFQGQFKADVWHLLGLPAKAFAMQGLEYHGDVGFLKAGIHFADAITTVSPTYAREIRTLAGGMGLDPMLRHPERVAVRIGYDEGLSHLLQGGCDAILVPSRYEPCGLTQLYGLRYGCVPVVARVGGLADTVIDANDAAVKSGVATGVQFTEISAEGLLEAVRKTVALVRRPEVWRRMQLAGMGADVGWQSSAAEYAALYRRLPRPKETT